MEQLHKKLKFVEYVELHKIHRGAAPQNSQLYLLPRAEYVELNLFGLKTWRRAKKTWSGAFPNTPIIEINLSTSFCVFDVHFTCCCCYILIDAYMEEILKKNISYFCTMMKDHWVIILFGAS
jgi:hypothetical protein